MDPVNTVKEPDGSLREPSSLRTFTTRERIIVLQGSKLNDAWFVPWGGAPSEKDFSCHPDYYDFFEYKLSSHQFETLFFWQPCPDLSQRLVEDLDPRPPAQEQDPVQCDLFQDLTTDCSVVASLCALTARTERGHPDLLRGRAFPWDEDAAQLDVKSTKFIFKMYFNGAYRTVVVDNRLPVIRQDRKWFVIDRLRPESLWAAIIEKAYLKVRGGYDFPGSNSCIDLWVLTGWLPEQIFLNGEDIDQLALWKRLSNAFNYGDVLITLGTKKMSESEERETHLVGEHAYAVLNLREVDNERSFFIKNPWAPNLLRKTAPSDESENATSLSAHALMEAQDSSQDQQGSSKFWMTFQQVFQNFATIYLNWNPCLWSERTDIHFTWNIKDNGEFHSGPQFAIRSEKGGLSWFLLSRHFSSREHGDKADLSEVGFICQYLFDNKGNRVMSPEGFVEKSRYVDSPCSLLKLDLSPNTNVTLVPSQQSLPLQELNFCLSTFSLGHIDDLSMAADPWKDRGKVSGKWEARTAGGNNSSPTYYQNPQYRLRLSRDSDVCLVLESASPELYVHVSLLWTSSRLRQPVKKKDIVCDSGEYNKHSALARTQQVPAGDYTVVCSTFEQGQEGTFEVSAHSTERCELDVILESHAGKFTQRIGDVHLTARDHVFCATLSTARLNRITISARSLGTLESRASEDLPTYKHALRIWLEQGPRGPDAKIIATSSGSSTEDTWADTNLFDACIEQADIQPKMCVNGNLRLCIERLAVRHDEDPEELVEIDILGDERVTVGAFHAIG